MEDNEIVIMRDNEIYNASPCETVTYVKFSLQRE